MYMIYNEKGTGSLTANLSLGPEILKAPNENLGAHKIEKVKRMYICKKERFK